MSEPVWISARVRLVPEVSSSADLRADALAGRLFELGAEGFEWREDQRPVEVVVAFPLEDLQGQEDLRAGIIAALETDAELVELSRFEDVDWAHHWRAHFTPLDFGPLWVVPSWLEAPTQAEAVLRVDPSSAFGTGLHPTTAMCLRAVVDRRPERILDVGTGTGILALAAVRLGGTGVGIDNDPEAIRVAMENRIINQVQPAALALSTTPVEAIAERFPFVVANILAGPLIELAPAIAATVARGGTLLLSGLLDAQAAEVEAAYRREGLEPTGGARDGEWARLDLVRPG